MKKILITENGMTIGYKSRILCRDITFDICEGDCIMLCGANGSGKTTFMKTLCSDEKGTVMVPTRIPKVAGFTTREFIRIACFWQSDMGGRLSSKDEKAITEAIEALGLTHLADRDISTLSDGEFQKGAIASALVRKASVILLDEPTAFLDAENRISVLKTLRELCDSRGTAVIFSTHDLHDGMKVATKVFALGADGRFRTTEKGFEDCIRTIFRNF